MNLQEQGKTPQYSDYSEEGSLDKICFKAQCQQKRQPFLICMNKLCENSAFLCKQTQCKCYLKHKHCMKGTIQSIQQAIEFKSKSLKIFEQKINEIIDSAIDKLSQLRDNILINFKQTFNLPALSKEQQIFKKVLAEGFPKEYISSVTGKDIGEIYNKIHEHGKIDKIIEREIEELTQIHKKILGQISTHSDNINGICRYLDKQFKINLVNQKLDLSTPQIYLNFSQSSIVKSLQEEEKINKFFQSPYRYATLLYRASENEFSARKFHELCDDIPNLLILCQTVYDKKIGGYTRLPFDTDKKGTYNPDNQGKNFLFSLTNDEKIKLNQNQFAIYYQQDKDFALRFGNGSDLRISNEANKNDDSYAAIDHAYKHPFYKQNDTNSCRRFTGSNSIYFRLKQWQVWKIEF